MDLFLTKNLHTLHDKLKKLSWSVYVKTVITFADPTASIAQLCQ